ncbi:DUF2630 family protein [Microbacterium gorillae]|uniref:DUF2630 family protein n=1 Tax=Microbacterium gorillae TaxID=1231063 RepID=UPI00058B75C2|nr:DUF2630 family protein [Microbacterium gorillae]
MNDTEITRRIAAIDDEQRTLRSVDTEGAERPAADLERLRALDVEKDQLWDLLRQRRAKAEFGEDPNSVAERPASEVEGYHD